MSRECTEPKRVVKCFNCDGEGHMSRECEEPKKEREPRTMTCYNCNGEGHMSRDCPDPKKERDGGDKPAYKRQRRDDDY